MGVIYAVVPVSEVNLRSAHIASYDELDDIDIINEAIITASSIKKAIDLINDFSSEISTLTIPPQSREEKQKIKGDSEIMSGATQSWRADITHDNDKEKYTTIIGHRYVGEDVPMQIAFEKGDPETIVLLLKNIAALHGPMLLLPDTGAEPAIVHGSTDTNKLMSEWEYVAE